MLELSHPDSLRGPGPAADADVIGQVKLAFAHPLPLVFGAAIGALVPIATYVVGHAELADAGWASVPGAIVAGGCAFSAITVYAWGRRAFDSALKAAGFVILAEGVMSFSTTTWLGLVMLGMLIAINAIANGANLAVRHLDAEHRRTTAVRDRAAEASPILVSVLAPSPALASVEDQRLPREAGPMPPRVADAAPVVIPPTLDETADLGAPGRRTASRASRAGESRVKVARAPRRTRRSASPAEVN